jgi:hypothetical protein
MSTACLFHADIVPTSDKSIDRPSPLLPLHHHFDVEAAGVGGERLNNIHLERREGDI